MQRSHSGQDNTPLWLELSLKLLLVQLLQELQHSSRLVKIAKSKTAVQGNQRRSTGAGIAQGRALPAGVQSLAWWQGYVASYVAATYCDWSLLLHRTQIASEEMSDHKTRSATYPHHPFPYLLLS